MTCILATTNIQVDEINEKASQLFPGEVKTMISFDQLVLDSSQAQIPVEFINKINLSGLPPHLLNLKVGMPIMTTRNVNFGNGVCNGTRLIITFISTRVIKAKISSGINFF
jgi:ATP-dependent DNA helicase PIF1